MLFFVAGVGHGYLLMVVLNVLYSRPIHRKFLKYYRLFNGLLLFGAPALFLSFVGYDLLELGKHASEHGAMLIPVAWAWFLVGVGGLALPFVTIWRLFRRTPPIVLREHTETVDVAKALGGRPVGNGKHSHQAAWRFNDIFNVEFTTLELAVDNLPKAWEGLSILHLSDFHFYGTPSQSYFEYVLQRCMEQGVPDLVVFSGDLLDDDIYLEWVAPVLGKLRWNVAAFAVLGNHDWWNDFDAARTSLSALGFRVLNNRYEVLEVRGEKLIALGHEGPWFRPAPDLTGAPEGFRLLVSHTPDNISWAKRNGVRLMLSGHNHGGQIRLPLMTSMFVPSKYSRKYDMGTFHEPPTILHVNRGLSGKEPLRFRSAP